jgi:GT2 family glycosyltransferase
LFQQALARVDYGSTVDLVGYPVCIPRDRPALAVSASALATTRAFFDRLGGFDERFFFGAEESDYCWRVVLAGGDIHMLADLVADHACGVSTAGGYIRRQRIETTTFRMVNRERNTLAMLIKCCGGASWVLVPCHVAYILAVAAGLALSGKADVARALLGGLWWNLQQLPETLRRRRDTPRSRVTAARAAARIEKRIVPLRMVLRHGLPRFVDVRSAAATSAAGRAGGAR